MIEIIEIAQPTYRPNFPFCLSITFVILCAVQLFPLYLFSVHWNFRHSSTMFRLIENRNKRRAPLNQNHSQNVTFSLSLLRSFVFLDIAYILTVLIFLLFLSGDVHLNPGPYSDTSSASFCTIDLYNFLSLPNHLSIVHYNVQSIANKVDLLISEFSYFDVLSFTETWLHSNHESNDLLFPTFHPPERKDRIGDRYGGVIIYVKDTIVYKRRLDLEPNRLECLWIEIKLSNSRKVLYGVFYRPPNSNAMYTSLIEDSIALAVDTNITDIIIMGDFNLNTMDQPHFRKTDSICKQFNFTQCIEEPTHFTENSMSVIDLLFVKNKESILTSGVGEPCLDLNFRYHCPIFGVFNFLKPRYKSFKRRIWKYDSGDYFQLRKRLSEVEWNTVYNDDENKYTQNISHVLIEKASQSIPNKTITVNPHDPPWITLEIKRKIRKRKRYYRRAKRTNSDQHWLKFKRLRNEVISSIRSAKKVYFDRMTLKLKSGNLNPRDWWKILK